MMTTMAALMGTLPIAMGFGAGAESRRPLGLAVVGGLLFSQVLTLYVTPVFYVTMDKLQKWLGRGRGKTEGEGRGAPLGESEPETAAMPEPEREPATASRRVGGLGLEPLPR
jgi:hypothetical protein